jgi:hypothetical protein
MLARCEGERPHDAREADFAVGVWSDGGIIVGWCGVQSIRDEANCEQASTGRHNEGKASALTPSARPSRRCLPASLPLSACALLSSGANETAFPRSPSTHKHHPFLLSYKISPISTAAPPPQLPPACPSKPHCTQRDPAMVSPLALPHLDVTADNNHKAFWLTPLTGRLTHRRASVRVQGGLLPLCKSHFPRHRTLSSAPRAWRGSQQL